MTRAKAFFIILLVCGAGILATASPALAAKSQPCWKQVINDWSQDGSIDGAYSAKCIEEALDRVPEDIRAYSDFEEQAKAARLAAGRALQSSGGSGSDNAGDGQSGSEDEAAPIKPRARLRTPPRGEQRGSATQPSFRQALPNPFRPTRLLIWLVRLGATSATKALETTM